MRNRAENGAKADNCSLEPEHGRGGTGPQDFFDNRIRRSGPAKIFQRSGIAEACKTRQEVSKIRLRSLVRGETPNLDLIAGRNPASVNIFLV